MGVNIQINDSIAITNISQTFQNPSSNEPQEEAKGNPIEFVYKFPKDKKSLIAKMTVTIGDRVVEAKIEEKEEAEEKYDNAVAQGHTATMVTDSRDSLDLHQLDVGNLLPGQSAIVELTLVQPL